MKKGTTPKQIITIKQDLRRAKSAEVFYYQRNQVIFIKKLGEDDYIYNPEDQSTKISFRIDQREMQRFEPGYANVEVDAVLEDGSVYKSDMTLIRITPSLNKIVMEVDDD